MSIAFIDDATVTSDASPVPPHSSRSLSSNQKSKLENRKSPRPLSQKRLLANRLNAQKSTGPRTKEGKKKVSQNALQHGLYCETFHALSPLLPTECQADFDNLEAELQNELKPKTATQTHLLHQIAILLWKLHRLNPTDRHLHHQSGTDEQTPPSLTLAHSLLENPSSSNPFLTLSRLEQRSQSLLLRYLKEFDRQQKLHPTIPYNPSEPPVPRQQAWPYPPPAPNPAPGPAPAVADNEEDDPAQAQLIQMIHSAFDQRPTSPASTEPPAPPSLRVPPHASAVPSAPDQNKPIQTHPETPQNPAAAPKPQPFAQQPNNAREGTNPLPPPPPPTHYPLLATRYFPPTQLHDPAPANKPSSMNTTSSLPSRRSAFKSIASLAAVAALPQWAVQDALAQEATRPATTTTRTERQFRIALVGCGGMGMGDGKNASRFGKIVAVCDVDQSHLANARKEFPDAEGYGDFRKVMERKDIDAVICATVDHWHTLVSMAAMKSGKDVYCEKPLTLTIDEGKRLLAVQRETNRIVQTGSQQRSDIRFRLAGDLVRAGRIGKLKHVTVWLPAGLRAGPFKPSTPPPGFDYDFWLGQTPKVDYVKERTHFSFRYWWEHSGGTMTDWGAHHNDIVTWVLGTDRSGPVSVEGKPLVEMIPGGFTAASEYDVLYTYENGITHACKSTLGSEWHGGIKDPNLQQHGIKFEGTDGWLFVTRGRIEASRPEIIREKLEDRQRQLYVSNDHMRNFFECVDTRREPAATLEIGHRSATLCHLGAIAIRTGRKLQWDPKAEHFLNDPDANQHLSREMRKPWDYSCI